MELKSRQPNPLLISGSDPEAVVDQIRKASHARALRVNRREIRDLRRKQSAQEAIDGFDRCIEIFGLTKGQFSLIDLIEATLQRIGPADFYLSTWTAANADVSHVLRFIDAGLIRSARWLVDLTFTRRSPQLAARIREAFGKDAIRVTRNHAKFSLLLNENWRIVLRTSMNLNFNPRLENFTIAHDPELADFLKGVFDDLWRRQARQLSDASPAAVKHWFSEEG